MAYKIQAMVYLQGPSLINNQIYSLHPSGQT